ncbi:response regulator transcription factor [Calidifontibacillus oryziterrae]|uniref:response regulator transcription factor n=1 Tax=Calidifontibacillus oryziterrae TaxID=1191699 RepID=UPI0002FDD6E8|nr:response regulator transcription factor [Calidifontibacillus oryziterrae]
MIKVLLVDDHALIRKGIRMLIETFPNISFQGEADEGEEAISLAHRLKPDVILMDLSMPNGLDGFSATKEIREQLQSTKIIILTMYDEEAYVKKAIEVQAHGYLLKKSQGRDLSEAITTVHNGKPYYKTSIPAEQIKKWWTQKDLTSKVHNSILTDREKEIVRLTMLGFSNKEMSIKLHISPKTVENHKARIMQKLNLSNKHELIKYGINNKYLELTL